MKTITPKRITFTRVGPNESWCGWQIAGQTPDVSAQVMSEFAKIQGSNAKAAQPMLEKTPDGNIFEFVCEANGDIIYFSKLKYGFVDDSAAKRANMRADTAAFSLKENAELLKHPQNVLSIDRSCFDNVLKIDLKRKENGELRLAEVTANDANTVYESKAYEISDVFSVADAVERIFGGKEKFCDFIKCLYWVLTYESWTTLYIVADFTDDEKLEFMTLAMSSLIYSFRKSVSFRTLSVSQPAPPVKIEFCKNVPSNGKYYDISSGKENVFSEILAKRYGKFDFISYYAQNYESFDADEYFGEIERIMGELGNRDSMDLNLIGIAHELYIEDNDEGKEELTELKLLQKFQNFLMMPYNNKVIDGHIASLLQVIMDNGVTLNDSLRKRLQDKLSKTDSTKLRACGYSYNAQLMISDSNREKEFEYLGELRKDEDEFTTTVEAVLAENGGDEFVDEFYGDYLGNIEVKDFKSLIAFYEETEFLALKQKISGFIKEKTLELCKKKVELCTNGEHSITKQMSEIVAVLNKVAPNSEDFRKKTVNEMKLFYWDKLDLTSFDYRRKADYAAVSYRSNERSAFVLGMIKQIDELRRGKKNAISEVKKMISDPAVSLTGDERSHIVKYIRKVCLSVIDTRKDIDFWLYVARLNQKDMNDFLLDGSVAAFTDRDLFVYNLYRSSLYKYPEKADSLIEQLLRYAEKTGNKKLVLPLIDELKYAKKERQREIRNDEKERQKIAKKNLQTAENRFETDEDVVIRSSRSKKESGGFISSLFKKKK